MAQQPIIEKTILSTAITLFSLSQVSRFVTHMWVILTIIVFLLFPVFFLCFILEIFF